MFSVTLFTRVYPAFNKMPGLFIRALLTQVTEDGTEIQRTMAYLAKKFVATGVVEGRSRSNNQRKSCPAWGSWGVAPWWRVLSPPRAPHLCRLSARAAHKPHTAEKRSPAAVGSSLPSWVSRAGKAFLLADSTCQLAQGRLFAISEELAILRWPEPILWTGTSLLPEEGRWESTLGKEKQVWQSTEAPHTRHSENNHFEWMNESIQVHSM